MAKYLNSKYREQDSVIIIEDKDIKYVSTAAKLADRFGLTLMSFVAPLNALDYLYKRRVSPKYILVDYFLPQFTGDIFIKKASKFVDSNFILFSVSGSQLLSSLDSINVYGIIKKQGIKHFEKVLSYYFSDNKKNSIELPFNYILLRDLGIIYLKEDPNVFIPLTAAETVLLSNYKTIDGVFSIKGMLMSIVSISTVMRLNRKLANYNVPFRIRRRFANFVIEQLN